MASALDEQVLVKNCIGAVKLLCNEDHGQECDEDAIRQKCGNILRQDNVANDLNESKQTQHQMNSFF